jgi:hypothetical protein
MLEFAPSHHKLQDESKVRLFLHLYMYMNGLWGLQVGIARTRSN